MGHFREPLGNVECRTKLVTLRARITNRAGEYASIAAKHPSWLLMFIFSRILIVRRTYRAARRLQTNIQKKTGKSGNLPSTPHTAFPEVEVRSVVERLRRDGVAQGITLPGAIVDEILAFSGTAVCFGNSRRSNLIHPHDFAMKAHAGKYIIADYLDGINSCDAITRLCTDPVLVAVAGDYMGVKPQLLRSRLWWSFVADGMGDRERADYSQQFHFDLDDWMCCKYFFYITETTERHGPHQYVQTSHRRRPLSLQLSLLKAQSAKRIHDMYGPANILTVTGPSGYGFVEDPFGIHRGAVPLAHPRLILEIEFGSSERQFIAGRYGVPAQ
jgi:hypothetical protein